MGTQGGTCAGRQPDPSLGSRSRPAGTQTHRHRAVAGPVRSAAAVVRAAAAVVPGAAGAGRQRVPHAAGPAAAGGLDRAALRAGAGRARGAARGAAHPFARADGEPVQRIEPPEVRLPLRSSDLPAAAGAAAALARLQRGGGAAPFDLARGPLIRGRLLRLAADDHVLLLTMHHIVVRRLVAWACSSASWPRSTRPSARRRRSAPAAADPVRRLRRLAARSGSAATSWTQQLGYWRASWPARRTLLELPTDRPRPPVQDYRGGAVRIELSTPS